MILTPDEPPIWLDEVIARYEQLVIDLKRIRHGEAPTAAELNAAPRISDYRIGLREFPCLMGQVQSHPHLNDDWAVTSDLMVLAPDAGWARTLSRFYRLGDPARDLFRYDA